MQKNDGKATMSWQRRVGPRTPKYSAALVLIDFSEAVSTLGSPAGESSRKDAGKAEPSFQDDFEAYVGKPMAPVERNKNE